MTVESDVIQKHLDAAYRDIGKTAKLKGFRPGKAPRKILEQYYRRDAEEKALKTVVQTTYPEALIQKGIQPVSSPQIQVISSIPDKELKYAAIFEVRPQPTNVKGYRGMKLTKEEIEVGEQEVADRIQAYQQSHAKLVPIDPPRHLEPGDVVVLDYEALREGQPFKGNKVQGYMAEIGSGVLMADFEKELKKIKVKEEKEIHVTFPTDFADKNFAGKKMSYKVVLMDAKKKVVPEVNDDFAKDLGVENLKALNERAREEIRSGKEQAARGQLHRQIIENLVQQNQLEIPEGMIETELEAMYNQLLHNLKRQNLTPDKVGLTPQLFRERNQEDAKLRACGMVLFEAIWKQEELTVSDEERDKKMEMLAAVVGQKKAAVAQYYQQDPTRIGHLDAMILEDKTLDLIVSQAKIKTVSEKNN